MPGPPRDTANSKSLAVEAERMEKKLHLLKDLAALESDHKESREQKNEKSGLEKGNVWKSGTAKKPLRKGYIAEVSTHVDGKLGGVRKEGLKLIPPGGARASASGIHSAAGAAT